MEPQIISSFEGYHNADLTKTVSRLNKEAAYKDLSTIIVIPAFGSVPTKTVASWLSLYSPPNQKLVRLFALGMEVGEAYSSCLQSILNNPDLSKFKYICFIEHDNCPPPDGLVKLLQQMESNKKYAGISGLYFTKGFGGQPQIWGDPKDPILNFKPCPPDPNGGLVECCGLGNGFTVFRLDLFKDEKIARPWFKTTASMQDGMMTQDLYFAKNARLQGYRFAVDCSIKVGHYDLEGKFGPPDTMW
jgi:hypothetical protein